MQKSIWNLSNNFKTLIKVKELAPQSSPDEAENHTFHQGTPHCLRNRHFIAVFRLVHCWTVFWASWIHSVFNICCNAIFQSKSVVFPLHLFVQKFRFISVASIHAACLVHSIIPDFLSLIQFNERNINHFISIWCDHFTDYLALRLERRRKWRVMNSWYTEKQVYRYINLPGEQVSIGGHCTWHVGDQLQFGFKRKISN